MRETTTSAVITGGYVFWECCTAPHAALLARLDAIDLKKFCPPPRSISESMRAALTDYKHANKVSLGGGDELVDLVIEPLKNRECGFVITRRVRGEVGNEHTPIFSATVARDADNEIVSITSGDANVDVIQCSYNQYRKQIEGAAIGRSLVELLRHFHGTCMRTAGGLYYLPEAHSQEWDAVVDAYESVSAGIMITHSIVQLDDSTIRAVRKAVSDELTTRASEIAKEIRDNALGEDALKGRVKQAQELLNKVSEYEEFLNQELFECRIMIDLAMTAASSGDAVQEDNELFDGMYLAQ